jgi:hypothetical protein
MFWFRSLRILGSRREKRGLKPVDRLAAAVVDELLTGWLIVVDNYEQASEGCLKPGGLHYANPEDLLLLWLVWRMSF